MQIIMKISFCCRETLILCIAKHQTGVADVKTPPPLYLDRRRRELQTSSLESGKQFVMRQSG